MCLPSCHVWLITIAMYVYLIATYMQLQLPSSKRIIVAMCVCLVAIQQHTTVVWAKISSPTRAWTRWWMCAQKLVRPHNAAGNRVLWGMWATSPMPTHRPCSTWHAKTASVCQDSCKLNWTMIQTCGRVAMLPHV